ncbi:hypothetical protein HBN50_03930 [Halobacteriovorax sp. GB3]|uniref:hypothetical protein n=1 Tax=Halobacteriovorax sp. GB3 TaxID=2719615 RepID=UPI00235E8680|nr:hypothetical protein [Halobacteriovorax sp. GB3]MDD0852229.1 hypothetical protein [Halobacteriovorax sp. GB3]
MKTFILILTTFFLGLANAHAAVSDELPIELVEQLVQKNMWPTDLEREGSQLEREISAFVRDLKSEQLSKEDFVARIFESTKYKNSFTVTYPIKVAILRYYADFRSTSYNKELRKHWVKNYVLTALSLIKVVGDDSIQQTARQFERLVVRGEIEVEDLGLKKRKELSGHHDQHTHDLMKKDDFGNFLVTGAFNRDKNIFLIDLARRSIEETLVTFVHEMIHATDKGVKRSRDYVLANFDDFLSRVSRYHKGDKTQLILNLKNLEGYFYEKDFGQLEDKILAKKDRNSKVEMTLLDSDRAKIKSFLSELINMSVMNEYHAYGRSLKFLYQLSNNHDLVFSSLDHYKDLLQSFRGGDSAFIFGQGYLLNPFSNLKVNLLRGSMTGAEKVKLGRIISKLESIYLEILSEKKEETKNYSFFIKKINLKGQDRRLPEWVDDLSIPTNPYQILPAKVTTARVAQFKKDIKHINEFLSTQAMKLYSLKLGVLDLSDVNQGELKLLGIQWEESRFQNVDSSLKDKFRMDLNLINEEVKEHFKLYQWSPKNVNDQSNKYIESEKVIQNLIKLKLLKTSIWIDRNLYAWKMTLMSSRTFVEKLRSGLYVNPLEISDERSVELEEELIENLKKASDGHDSILELKALFNHLAGLYSMTLDEDWASLSQATHNKIQLVQRVLDGLNVYSSYEVDASEHIDQIQESYVSQLRPYVDYCAKTDDFINLKARGQFKSSEYFNFKGHQFSLMLSCFNGKLHAVRQPGDFTRYMTLIRTLDGKNIKAKIFRGSRNVLLSPVKINIKKRKKFLGIF